MVQGDTGKLWPRSKLTALQPSKQLCSVSWVWTYTSNACFSQLQVGTQHCSLQSATSPSSFAYILKGIFELANFLNGAKGSIPYTIFKDVHCFAKLQL